MPIYTKESLENLRTSIDLLEVLKPHIELKKSGASYKALCPFHDEKTASFMVSKGDSHYHCFGCGAHGDAIQFLIEYLNLSFIEAVDSLAELFHVILQSVDRQEDSGSSISFLKEALETASLFYHFYLQNTQDGKEALSYLYSRGLNLDFVKRFELGLAPKRAGVFRKVMHEKKISDQILLESGLQNSSKRDFFIDRITFPIRNATGSVIGFSARNFKENSFGGKYINTKETTLFKKSKILFGLNYSRRRIAKEGKAIVVEGQIDCLKMIESGFNCTVATLGTAVGDEHVKILKNLGVRRVFLLFDSDKAGQLAVSKTGDLFQKVGIEVIVVSLPTNYDPDSFLIEYGADKLLQEIQNGRDYLSFQLQFLSKKYNANSPAGKSELINTITSQINEWKDPIMVHESLEKLASLAHIPKQILGINQANAPLYYLKSSDSASIRKIDPNRILELDLLRWLILFGKKHPDFVETTKKNIDETYFWVSSCKSLFLSFLKNFSEKEDCDLLKLLIDVEDEDSKLLFDEIFSKKINKDRAEKHFIETLQKLLDRQWLQKREEIKIKIHSGIHSDEEVFDLAKEFDALKNNRQTISIL